MQIDIIHSRVKNILLKNWWKKEDTQRDIYIEEERVAVMKTVIFHLVWNTRGIHWTKFGCKTGCETPSGTDSGDGSGGRGRMRAKYEGGRERGGGKRDGEAEGTRKQCTRPRCTRRGVSYWSLWLFPEADCEFNPETTGARPGICISNAFWFVDPHCERNTGMT